MNHAPRRGLAYLLLVVLSLPAIGCTPTASPAVVIPPVGVSEIPAANLPVELRPHNWTDRGGSGSCVNASTVYNLRWTSNESLADWWRKNHAGGETTTTIRQHHDARNLRYYFTLSADPRILDWCTVTRRSALIWYYPRHCITFAGFHGQHAHLIDNNRPTQVIRVEREEFLRNWAGYGGFALALANPPVPPPLYDARQRPQSL